jgi:hypothetical protein
MSEQAKRDEKVVVVIVKHAPRSMFLEGKSTAKVGIHPQHVM